MYEDEIIREVWRAKDAISAEFGYDIKKLAEHYQNVYASLQKKAIGSAKTKPMRRSRVQRTKRGISVRGSRKRTLVRPRSVSGRAAAH